MSHQESAVRSEVASCFSAILGHDQQARKLAEEELNTLEVTEGGCNHAHFLFSNGIHGDRVWAGPC